MFFNASCSAAADGNTRGDGEKLLAGRAKAQDKNGMDTTQYLLTGAEKVLKIAKAYNAKFAILKESSPSCGVKKFIMVILMVKK